MIHGHGGNIYQLARELGCDPTEIVDMSSNVNPLGPPPELMDHLKAHLGCIKALPEVAAESMERMFADHNRIDANQVMAGSGTTQMIYDLPRALEMREALIVGPTYVDYADGCRLGNVACRFAHARESDHFKVDADRLREQIAPVDAVYICNPNNPTGQLIDADAIRELCQDFPRQQFIVDESYLPFVKHHAHHSLLRDRPANALVLTSMSKIFRIPGLRVGFIVGEAGAIQRLRHLAPPWSVNSLAQTAVRFLLTNEPLSRNFIARTQAFIAAERGFMIDALAALTDLRIYPSHTSFFILRLPEPYRAVAVCRALSADRILVRDCTNFEGLSERFVRISLKTTDVNRQCVALLQALLQR
ncbi:MAG: aminotransferase class I/II-fold pyridoxal phosphate-dependent enzyme [Desulfobacterales bacterium]|jgi:threonine-phosphate decarboxylase